MKRIGAILLLAMLAGCAGDQANRQQAHFGAPPKTRAVIVDPPAETQTPAPAAKVEAVSSQNATQVSQSGAVNAEIRKLAEKIDAALAKFETNARDISAVKAEAAGDLAAFKAQVDQKFDIATTATANLVSNATANVSGRIGRVETELSATAKGIDLSRSETDKHIDEVRQKAGGDAVTTVNSGVKEMEAALENTNALVWKLCTGAFGLVTAVVWFLLRRNSAQTAAQHAGAVEQVRRTMRDHSDFLISHLKTLMPEAAGDGGNGSSENPSSAVPIPAAPAGILVSGSEAVHDDQNPQPA